MRSQRLLSVALSLVLIVIPLAVPRQGMIAGAGSAVSAAGTDRGVQFSFHVPSGPYFLGELLPVTALLANHTGHPIFYTGAPGGDFCGGTWVHAGGGTAPLFNVPFPAISCPGPGGGMVAAGRSLTARFVVALTASNDVTLKPQQELVHALMYGGRAFFAGGGPILHIHVTPAVPPDRLLRLSPMGRYLSVGVAHGRVPRLLVIHQVSYSWNAYSAVLTWQPIRGHLIRAPQSMIDGHHEKWTVIIGAAGYRIVVASYRRVPL